MAEERRRGLSGKKQEEMYDTLMMLKTHLLGAEGSPGKLDQFEEQDKQLDTKIESVKLTVGKIQKTVWKAIGAATILLPVVTAFIIKGVEVLSK